MTMTATSTSHLQSRTTLVGGLTAAWEATYKGIPAPQWGMTTGWETRIAGAYSARRLSAVAALLHIVGTNGTTWHTSIDGKTITITIHVPLKHLTIPIIITAPHHIASAALAPWLDTRTEGI